MRLVRVWRERGFSIGLVPTMGAIHAGHQALVENALEDKRFKDRASVQELGLRSAMCVPLEGTEGALLWAVATADGKRLAEYKLDAMPAFDSMAAARGRLYLSTTDGRVLCFADR